MAIEFSTIIKARVLNPGRSFSVRGIDLMTLAAKTSPVLVLDRFRVGGRPFLPHAHAGFSALIYVLDDSLVRPAVVIRTETTS
jgi:hypothetical protein